MNLVPIVRFTQILVVCLDIFFFEERNSLTVNKHRLDIRYGNIVLDKNASILAKNKLVSKIKLTEIYYAYYAI